MQHNLDSLAAINDTSKHLSRGGWVIGVIIMTTALMLLSMVVLRGVDPLRQHQNNQISEISSLITSLERMSDSASNAAESTLSENVYNFLYEALPANLTFLRDSLYDTSNYTYESIGVSLLFPDNPFFNGEYEQEKSEAYISLVRLDQAFREQADQLALNNYLQGANNFRVLLRGGFSHINEIEKNLPSRLTAFIAILFLIIAALMYVLWFQIMKPLIRSLEKRHSNLMAHSKELDYLAYHDALTGIKNRQFFTKTINTLLSGNIDSTRFALVMLDLNRFKMINDSYGHDAGDLLLKEVSRILIEFFPKDQVMRLGGDEFAILALDMSKSKLSKCMDNVIKETFEPIYHNDSVIQCSISAGIAMYPDDAVSQTELMRRADMALYTAKTYRRNQKNYCFYADLGFQSDKAQLPKYHDFVTGIASGEFKVYYSPQFSLTTKAITGAEALLRWEHPKYGKINVEHLITSAEQLGLINKITELVLDDVARLNFELDRLKWSPFKLGINFSGGSKEIEDAVQSTLHVLKRQPSLADNLVVEITEKVIFGARGFGLSERLDPLREHGIKVSLDDFGTGFASLTHLTEIEFDVLKIDRSFVLEMEKSNTSKNIIKSMISLSHALNKEVIAEGIETEDQLNKIAELGCDAGQGYYISRPIPRNEFIALLSKQSSQSSRSVSK